jgi:hypothetical protein
MMMSLSSIRHFLKVEPLSQIGDLRPDADRMWRTGLAYKQRPTTWKYQHLQSKMVELWRPHCAFVLSLGLSLHT